jgi:hypothetical protein
MEQVNFSKTLAVLRVANRVQRAAPRGNPGRGSPFSNLLRRKKEHASPPDEVEGVTPVRAAEEENEDSGRRRPPAESPPRCAEARVIDVRV